MYAFCEDYFHAVNLTRGYNNYWKINGAVLSGDLMGHYDISVLLGKNIHALAVECKYSILY